MAIELPHEVVVFLNFIGVPYPDIDEDQVRELAGHVRTFADEVSETHESATGTISEMGGVYQGQSYRALVASWAQLSSTHMERLDELCRIVATALEIAADVITAVKVAVLAELALLASAYTAAMAATVVTSGTSAALGQSLALAARRLVGAMEEVLVGYIVAEVLGKAIEPLEAAVSDMIQGAVYGASADMLGVDPGGSDVVLVDPDELRRYAQVLDDHADDIMKHAAKFGENVAALDFSTPVGPPEVATPSAAGGRPGTTGPGPTVAPSGAPGSGVPADNPAQRNWIPGPARGAYLPGESFTPDPAESPPRSTAPDGSGAAAPGGASAPGIGPLPATAARPETGSPIEAAPTPAAAPGPEVAGIRAEADSARGPAPASPEPARAATAVDPAGPSAAGVGEAAGNTPHTVPGDRAEAPPGGSTAGGQARDQPNPWNRPAAQATGQANRAAGPAPVTKAPGAGIAASRSGGLRKGSPWARPANELVSTPTPWSKPDEAAAQPVPPRPAVVAAKETAPPSTALSGSRAKPEGAESEPGTAAVVAPEPERDEAGRAAVVSAPPLREEGPPRG
ncbi:hypothetical protein ACFWPH_22555 [Nocardia sp. NPDC058499]|uniref:WXG100 family type VII secretion target n=1 Tax=Nocardia sp. NPDC058499 TaxID=3346530 RepID=UPI003656476E